MAIRSHNQVLAGADLLAGRTLGKAAKRYRRQTIGPLVAAIGSGKTFAAAMRALGTGLVKKMDTEPEAMAIAEAGVQVELIAVTAATPKRMDNKRETR